jgi:hypothetical protein
LDDGHEDNSMQLESYIYIYVVVDEGEQNALSMDVAGREDAA